MNRYNEGFREPPWVIGSPKEVMDWIDASHPSKDKKKEKHRLDKEYLTNLNIKFDFDVKRKELVPPNFLSRIINGKMVEEDFELYPIAELILRGLAKAKFKNLDKLVIDRKTLYEHPERKSDLRKTIDHIDDFSDEIKKGKNADIYAILDDFKKTVAKIKIKKIHKIKDHSVEIIINGRINKQTYKNRDEYKQAYIVPENNRKARRDTGINHIRNSF